MYPEEKADDLIKKFYPFARTWDCWNDEPDQDNNPKKCALMAVEEMITYLHWMDERITLSERSYNTSMFIALAITYWTNVKEELTNIKGEDETIPDTDIQ